MGDWLHGAWALYSVLAWAGKSKRLDLQASPLHMSLWSWEWMGSRHEGPDPAPLRVVVVSWSPETVSGGAGVPGAVAGLEKNTFTLHHQASLGGRANLL